MSNIQKIINCSVSNLAQLLAAWLLTDYLIPGTFVSSFSARAMLSELTQGNATRSCVFWEALVAASVCISFLRRESNWCLWLSTLAYLSIMLVHAFKVPEITQNVNLVLIPFITGLIAARVAGSHSKAIRVMVVLSSIQAALAIWDYQLGRYGLTSGSVGRAGGTYGRPNYLYIIVLISLPLASAFAMECKRRSESILWTWSVIILFAALLLTWYRGGLLAATVSLTWLCHQLRVPRRCTLAIVAVLLVFTTTVVLVRMIGPNNASSSARSISGRYRLWKAGWLIFERNWFTGVGFGQLKINIHANQNGITTNGEYLQPQNLLLDWLDNMGLLGGILFFLFAASIGKIILNNKSSISAGIGSAWLAIFVAGLTDTPFGVSDRVNANAIVGVLVGLTLLLEKSPRYIAFTNRAIAP